MHHALARHGLVEQAGEINRRGVALARSPAGDRAYVAGAVGPTGPAGPAPAAIVVRATNTSGQSIAGSASSVVVTGWTEVTDTDAAFDPTTGIFTVPVERYYVVTASLEFTAISAGAGGFFSAAGEMLSEAGKAATGVDKGALETKASETKK